MRAKRLTFNRAKDLRRSLTLPEVILWRHLRPGGPIGLRFRRQHPMGAYMIDLYSPAARLAVEIDGEGHGHPDQARHDLARDRWLTQQGVRVLRFPATHVLHEEGLWGVLREIEAAANLPLRSGGSTAEGREGGARHSAGAPSPAPSTPSGSPSPATQGRIGSAPTVNGRGV